ncbi:MAG TPA: type IV-A pilus assembly ATPase PilB, partial [Gammaproteobacteria bacterium]|nr:type IV-A pilus assembly ATPase PilB [Gammaproteobacteria bacterium]
TDLISSEHLSIHLVRKRLALPVLQKGGILYLAITDPTIENLYEARFLTGFDIRLFIVEASKLTQVIDELLNSLILSEINVNNEEQLDQITINAYKEDNADVASYDIESTPVVNYVNRVLLDAIEKGASDIHFERYEDTYRIRFRQYGILYPITAPPLKLANYLLARIKVMSNLDITEHRVPQDGRFKLIISRKRAVDFRVSVCPTLFGEKIVLRILDPSHTFAGIDLLGMDAIQQEHLMAALKRSQGFILVTGPTGSGKTVTLYSSLNYLNSTEKNISTVEDPVEIPLEGINQVNVNPKTGLTFSTALRAFLRQDPDIIMVGEIRDIETAEIAIKASQTGHLVLSTLHTNSAPETITRLISMGIAPYNLASSLTLVLAQRLLRVLCKYCKIKQEIPDEILLKEGFKQEELASLQLYEAASCDHCMNGFKGRSGIFEVMPVSSDMAALIMRGGNALEIVEQARHEGIINLRESGLRKVAEGVTSLAELNRVFK